MIGVGILALLVLGALGYGIMKVNDVYTEKIKPDMIKYVQMTKEDQNKYIINHMEEILKGVQEDDAEVQQQLEALRNDDASRQAGIEFGRSLCASLINVSDDITDTLSPEDKAMYKQEADAVDARSKHFDKVMKEYAKKTSAVE